MPCWWAMLHMMAASTAPPTCECSSVSSGRSSSRLATATPSSSLHARPSRPETETSQDCITPDPAERWASRDGRRLRYNGSEEPERERDQRKERIAVGDVVMLEDNAIEVLSYWDLRLGAWQVIGFVTSALEAVSRPILRIGDGRYLLLRQPPDLSEN